MPHQQSYFALGDWHPKRLIERWLNPYRHYLSTTLHGYPLTILATPRAARALSQRSKPLAIELQLYFSCVVKKRVLFDEEGSEGERLSDQLIMRFRAVQASSCDPIAFAASYPEQRLLDSEAALKMHPSRLYLDRRHGRWQGQFDI